MRTLAEALLVTGEGQRFKALRNALEEQGIGSRWARSFAEAQAVLRKPGLPQIIFTDTSLPDGDWESVLQLALKTPAHVDVIVVSPWVDIKLYLDAIERGAQDFIVPPFEAALMKHVVHDVVQKGAEDERPAISRADVA
ncbi:MAG TPA: response regulator [Terriglobia bacterium]|nr:response regulator [Terriglobia bacterium]